MVCCFAVSLHYRHELLHLKKILLYISQNYSFAMLRSIQEVFRIRGDEVQWFLEGKEVTPSYLSSDEKLITTVPDIYKYQPDVVIATSNFIPSFLPGLKVAVFHGFDAGKLDRKGNNDHFKIRGCFDLYCTQGPSTTNRFKELQKEKPYCNIIETGWATYDRLFPLKVNKSNDHKRTIFLCSTFSKSLTQAEYLFPTVKALSKKMDWQWIVALHPKIDKKVVDLYRTIESENVSNFQTDDIIPLLKQADVMVGDTTSTLTMFMVQDKPVVTVNNINPQPYFLNITNAKDLETAIEHVFTYPADLMKSINDYNKEQHPYNDGKSSLRVVQAIDDVLDNKYPLEKTRPLNFFKNLKYRKRLNYWQFYKR